MADNAVLVKGLSKRYRIAHQHQPYGRLTESLSDALRAPFDRLKGKPRETTEWIWALRDVSFDVRQGDVVGIIGRNGAGKTTLLKVLSRITEPSVGEVLLRGRVASLLEVGTGFHSELTGRENVFMSGAVLGMRRAEINQKFDEIVEFAGVEQFLDTPVKRYSSGMLVRLGFAVAAHLETEILIVDEVLAVGDAEFQRKCLSKIGDASYHGRTVLFVSHNMPAVESLCTSGIVLDAGSIVARGSAREVAEHYLRTTFDRGAADVADRQDRQGNGRLRFLRVETSLRTGGESELRLMYSGGPDLRNVEISVALSTSHGESVANLWTESTGETFQSIPPRGTIVCSIPKTPIRAGAYMLNLYCTVNGVLADWVIDAAIVDIADGDYFGTGKLPPEGYGFVLVPHRWSVEPAGSSLGESDVSFGLH